MRLVAQKSIKLQDAYPIQACGGYDGIIHKSVSRALAAWEAKRGIKPMYFGKNRAKNENQSK